MKLEQYIYLYGNASEESWVIYSRTEKVRKPISSLRGLFISERELKCDANFPLNSDGQLVFSTSIIGEVERNFNGRFQEF